MLFLQNHFSFFLDNAFNEKWTVLTDPNREFYDDITVLQYWIEFRKERKQVLYEVKKNIININVETYLNTFKCLKGLAIILVISCVKL